MNAEQIWEKHGIYWWWNAIGTPQWNNLISGLWPWLFNTRYERSAFLYELRARLTGGFEFNEPWLRLTKKQKDELAGRWPMRAGVERWIVEYATAKDKPPYPNWSTYQTVSWNLKHNDSTLVSNFLDWIHNERKRLGIPDPKPNEGQRRRKLSWRPLELLDIQKVKGRKLTDAERSQVSKVKKLWRASI